MQIRCPLLRRDASVRRDETQKISGYRFDRADLLVDERQQGISAFMRIRNGAAFLELTIRSHIEFFDEIVAVYNDCTDETPEILSRLQHEFGARKLRVIHYADPVFPPGSEGHARTDPSSPNSLVNYYNFALASTRFRFATKLDDDHLAIATTTKSVTDSIRRGLLDESKILCFSGLNLFRRPDGNLAILQRDPVSGGGDIGFFRVSSNTFFSHDRRFEKFRCGGARRQFTGFLYWHLKYLKPDMGFGNYSLDENPSSRYAKHHAAMQNRIPKSLDLQTLANRCKPRVFNRLMQMISNKQLLVSQRNEAIRQTFPDQDVERAIRRTVDPQSYSALLDRLK